jgi:hypothetical protein
MRSDDLFVDKSKLLGMKFQRRSNMPFCRIMGSDESATVGIEIILERADRRVGSVWKGCLSKPVVILHYSLQTVQLSHVCQAWR